METTFQASYPLNSENERPFGTFTVYLSCAKASTPAIIGIVSILLQFIAGTSGIQFSVPTCLFPAGGCGKAPALTAPSKIRGNALIPRWTSRQIAVTAEKNVDTTVDAARLEARATKRKAGTRIFMARAWAIGPWTLPVVAALLMRPSRIMRNQSTQADAWGYLMRALKSRGFRWLFLLF